MSALVRQTNNRNSSVRWVREELTEYVSNERKGFVGFFVCLFVCLFVFVWLVFFWGGGGRGGGVSRQAGVWSRPVTNVSMYNKHRKLSRYSVLEIAEAFDSKLFVGCFGFLFVCLLFFFYRFTICVLQKLGKKHNMNCFHRILTFEMNLFVHARVNIASRNFPLAIVRSVHLEYLQYTSRYGHPKAVW